MTTEEDVRMDGDDMTDSRIYEASFHLVPTLDEEAATAEVASFKEFVESRGATILGGGAPLVMELAYPLEKNIERKRHIFTQSYFGWIVFEADPAVAHEMKEMLLGRDSIIRSLLMKTVKEAAEDRPHPASFATPEAADLGEGVEISEGDLSTDGADSTEDDDSSDDGVDEGEIDVEQVDAEIDKLVTE